LFVIAKVAHVSATTQIEYAEEMQLLETGQVRGCVPRAES
jgi:hypothetical protein